ncbi:hypothetical protein KGY79_09150, partial [Candidatus Bipolaricaulota bacterium]|nr:hypothetical protein [Candidatus Bipolaricaulota bacterium]
MKTNNSPTIKTFPAAITIILLLLSIGLPVTRVNAISDEEPKTTTNFSTRIGLTYGEIKISYSSDMDELLFVHFGSKGEKEHEASFSSEKRLGLLIAVDRERLSYFVAVLEKGEVWDPFKGELDVSEYRKRARLSQKPGWEVLVIEKSETHLAT